MVWFSKDWKVTNDIPDRVRNIIPVAKLLINRLIGKVSVPKLSVLTINIVVEEYSALFPLAGKIPQENRHPREPIDRMLLLALDPGPQGIRVIAHRIVADEKIR